MVFSHRPPVRLAPESALAVGNGVPQADTTVAVAPADPSSFKSDRRSILPICSDMDSTLLECPRSSLIQRLYPLCARAAGTDPKNDSVDDSTIEQEAQLEKAISPACPCSPRPC